VPKIQLLASGEAADNLRVVGVARCFGFQNILSFWSIMLCFLKAYQLSCLD